MPRIPLLLISLYFLIGGVAHFVATEALVAAMPDYLSYHRELVYVSGVFELLGAIGILYPKSRLLAGYGLMALCVAVFTANIHMFLHPQQFSDVSPWFLMIRLPLQGVFIWFIWWAIAKERLDFWEQRKNH